MIMSSFVFLTFFFCGKTARRKNLALEEKLKFALQIALGMNDLHLHNPPIVHRDLKSLNILVDESFKLKIADFGMTPICTHSCHANQPLKHICASGLSRAIDSKMTNFAGTFHWMAPEVMSGLPYTTKADVFSYGIVLWEIMSQVELYPGMDALTVMNKVRTQSLAHNT
jgi:serine/threonine protein kinase